jgi:hypothetical protein
MKDADSRGSVGNLPRPSVDAIVTLPKYAQGIDAVGLDLASTQHVLILVDELGRDAAGKPDDPRWRC